MALIHDRSHDIRRMVDFREAPEGFYAVPKPASTPNSGNLCRQCDWRSTCQKPDTDFSLHNHRCMSTGVILRSAGQVVERKDKCSVLFKRLPISQEPK